MSTFCLRRSEAHSTPSSPSWMFTSRPEYLCLSRLLNTGAQECTLYRLYVTHVVSSHVDEVSSVAWNWDGTGPKIKPVLGPWREQPCLGDTVASSLYRQLRKDGGVLLQRFVELEIVFDYHSTSCLSFKVGFGLCSEPAKYSFSQGRAWDSRLSLNNVSGYLCSVTSQVANST